MLNIEKIIKIKTEEGFTLIEVLVSILVITLFMLTGLQALAIAMVYQFRAQETAEATLAIQEDLETVKYAAATLAEDTTKCSASSTSDGYGDALNDALTAESNYTFSNRTYTMTRTETIPDVAPYNVLQLEYEVTDPDSQSVASLYTEVIPDVAFNCP